jgi:tetratricopeptide (TPR) repeat protein
MTDHDRLPREELERLVTEAALLTRVEQYADAVKIFEAHLPQLSSGTDDDKRVAAAVFSYYGLCIAALRKQYSDGIKYCELSLKVQPSNSEHYENQGKIHLLARSRARAVDALLNGLSYDPNNKGINRVLDSIGRRRPPVIGFLPRDNFLNVYFGKRRHEKFERRREEARNRRRKQGLDSGKVTTADVEIKHAQARAAEHKKSRSGKNA